MVEYEYLQELKKKKIVKINIRKELCIEFFANIKPLNNFALSSYFENSNVELHISFAFNMTNLSNGCQILSNPKTHVICISFWSTKNFELQTFYT